MWGEIVVLLLLIPVFIFGCILQSAACETQYHVKCDILQREGSKH